MTRLSARRESALERWACRWAREQGIKTSKLRDPVGIPDRIFWVEGGRPWLVEFKDADGGRLSEAQQWYLNHLHNLGYRVAVVESKEHFLEIMKPWSI